MTGTRFLEHIKRKVGTLTMAAAVATAAFMPGSALAGEISDPTKADYTFHYHNGSGYTAKDVAGFKSDGYLHVYIVEGSDVAEGSTLATAGNWNGNSVYYFAEDVDLSKIENLEFKDNTMLIFAQGAKVTFGTTNTGDNSKK